MNKKLLLSTLTGLSLLVLPLTSHAVLTPKEELGKFIFFDTNLSTPVGQSCGSCHDPAFGFADPDQFLPTSEGVVAGRFGRRNAPSLTYVGLTSGSGLFRDGRSPNLFEQAKLPFLNPEEMNNPDINTVVTKVCSSTYASLFKQVYGKKACVRNFTATEFTTAYDRIAEAVAAFESSSELSKFTSKFDAVQKGLATFTPEEARGQDIFGSPVVGGCFRCHELNLNFPPLLTDLTFNNIGLPKNTGFPFSTMDQTFVDLGRGAITGLSIDNGRFKTPSLRNVALTAPYMHNGVLPTLKDVVHFYNTRDVPGVWPAPEVSENIVTFFGPTLFGNLGLTSAQEDDLVAFLMTLSDGFLP